LGINPGLPWQATLHQFHRTPNAEIKLRTSTVSVVPNEVPITQPIGAIIMKPAEESAAQRGHYMSLETPATLSDDPFVTVAAVHGS
jgi:putative transposase